MDTVFFPRAQADPSDGWISDNNTACWPSTDTTSPFWMVDDQVGLRWSGSFEAAYWINSPDKDTGRTELFNGQTFDHCPSIWATVVQITLFLFPSKCKWTGIEESGNHCHLLSAHYCNHRVFVLVVREMHCPTRSSMNFKKASDGPGRDGNSGYLYICHKSNRSLGAFGDGVSDQMYNESFFLLCLWGKGRFRVRILWFVFFQNKSMVVERKHELFPLDYDAHSKVLSLFPGWNSRQEVFYFRVVNECVKDTSSQLFLSPFLQNIMLSLFFSANNRCVTLLLTSGGGGDAGGWHFNILC